MRDRRRHRLALRAGSDRPARRGCRRPDHSHGPDPQAGVRDPGRHLDSHRPRRRSEAVLLRKAQETRREYAGADSSGRLVWASPALPGSAHDLSAARTRGIIDALTNANVMTFADKGYQGARGSVRTPFRRHRYRPKLSPTSRSFEATGSAACCTNTTRSHEVTR
ncbi:transposase family protein [Actinomadura sp. HBU206391]|uniref:transposase family protein n=1 Tax=Actinomadura sp. HBU206391 TaxID=2731692 RepID=UPI003966C677